MYARSLADGKKENEEEEKGEEEANEENADEEAAAAACPMSNIRETVGELEITPVSNAIARHLGIDLSAEGRAARNRRGIVVIIHGPPSSGEALCLLFRIFLFRFRLLF